jgi:hypothetical protein
MASSVEKYWYAVGFWHAKTKEYMPPSEEEIQYMGSITGTDILKEYDKGYKAANRKVYEVE